MLSCRGEFNGIFEHSDFYTTWSRKALACCSVTTHVLGLDFPAASERHSDKVTGFWSSYAAGAVW